MSTPKGTIPWNAGKGSGWLNRQGYRERKVNGRTVKEHRWLMEQHLGRKLSPHELVHHKDGDKANNAIANLELTEWGVHTIAHHTGTQRPDNAKKTMQVLANLREENKRLQDLNTDMLAALKQLVTDFEDVPDPTDRDSQAVFEYARAAIAKATGEVEP